MRFLAGRTPSSSFHLHASRASPPSTSCLAHQPRFSRSLSQNFERMHRSHVSHERGLKLKRGDSDLKWVRKEGRKRPFSGGGPYSAFSPPRPSKVNLDELGAHGSTLILLRSIDGLQGHVPGLNLRNMTVFCLCLSLFSRASHRQGLIRRRRRRRKALVMTWLSLHVVTPVIKAHL